MVQGSTDRKDTASEPKAKLDPRVKVLRSQLRHGNVEMRRAAAVELGAVKDARIVAALSAALNDENPQVRNAAAQALDQLGWKPANQADEVRYLAALEKWDEAAEIAPSASLREFIICSGV